MSFDTMLHAVKPPFIAILLCLVFTGCGHVSKKDMALLSDPLSVDQALQKALTSQDYTVGAWPEEKWWESFHDLQLSSLIEEAIQKSPTIKKAQAKVIASEQAAKRVRSRLFPTLDADLTENWEYYSKNGFVRSFYPVSPTMPIPAKVNQLDVSLSFTYEFDFWGKNKKMFRAALGIARAERAEKAQAELILSTSIAFAYFELQTHRQELSLYTEMLTAREDRYNLIHARNTIGIEDKLPVLDSEESLNSLRETVVDLKKMIVLDELMIKMLLGLGPDTPKPLVSISLPDLTPFPLPEHLGTDLLARRPDLMAQIWQVESASQEIGVAKTAFYPDFNLLAFAGLESLSFNKLLEWGSRQGALQPAIHLPIFEGGRLKANLSNKVAEFNAAVEKYNEMLLEAVRQVASEIETHHSLLEQLRLQDKTVLAQMQKSHLVEERFNKGIDNYLSVLSSHETLLSTKVAKIELDNFQLLSRIRLIKALGGGYEYAHPQPYKNRN